MILLELVREQSQVRYDADGMGKSESKHKGLHDMTNKGDLGLLASRFTLWQGDCLEEMKRIPDGSVDMVLTDPP